MKSNDGDATTYDLSSKQKQRHGSAVADAVGADFTYSNNPEGGRFELGRRLTGADDGMCMEAWHCNNSCGDLTTTASNCDRHRHGAAPYGIRCTHALEPWLTTPLVEIALVQPQHADEIMQCNHRLPLNPPHDPQSRCETPGTDSFYSCRTAQKDLT